MGKSAFVLFALFLTLVGSASSQWQSVPRPGADFQSIAIEDGAMYAVGSGSECVYRQTVVRRGHSQWMG